MQDDLSKFFGLDAFFEMRTVSCFVMKTNDDVKKSFTKGGERGTNLEENSKLGKQLTNMPITVLINHLNNEGSFIFVDETELQNAVDIRLPNDLSEMQALKQALLKYGFVLKKNGSLSFL